MGHSLPSPQGFSLQKMGGLGTRLLIIAAGVSVTSPKCVDREALGRRGTVTKQGHSLVIK